MYGEDSHLPDTIPRIWTDSDVPGNGWCICTFSRGVIDIELEKGRRREGKVRGRVIVNWWVGVRLVSTTDRGHVLGLG